MKIKYCKKCGETNQDKFNPSQYSKCRKCARDYKRKWYLINKEKIKEYTRKWRLSNPDKFREYTRRWQESNPDKVAEAHKRWREKNPDKARELGNKAFKKWYEQNKEKHYQSHIFHKNRKAHNAQGLAWRTIAEQLCSIEGCNNIGQRHHPDYNKANETISLCIVHHKEEHARLKMQNS